jgi:type IX secretion system PorP/SprF family membrane protein
MFAVGSVAYGQSDIFLTQQWFSRININPAATGNSNNIDVFLLNRQQWTGFDNAPKTSVLNAHSYFNTIQSGLGLSLMFDRIGVSHETVDATLSYAYHIDLADEVLLSLGLSGGIYNSQWDPKKNSMSEEDDPELLTDKSSRTTPDFDAGFELNAYGMTFGASGTHLINSRDTYTGKPGRAFYAYARYRMAIDRNFEVAPSIMYHNSNRSNFFDLNVTGWYRKKYWAGLSFRPNNAFAVMLGAEINMFRVGYAYDRSVGATSSLAANTHEIMLSVRIQKPKKGRPTNRWLD